MRFGCERAREALAHAAAPGRRGGGRLVVYCAAVAVGAHIHPTPPLQQTGSWDSLT